MKQKKLDLLRFEYKEKEYVFGFGLDQVKTFANLSIKRQGSFDDLEFIKLALSKYSKAGFITDKVAKEIRDGIYDNGFYLGEGDDADFMEYPEFIEYLVGLYLQAINDAAEEVNPAVVTINENGSVDVLVDGNEYKLQYTREAVKDLMASNIFDYTNYLELYIVGSTMIRFALQHYDKHMSVKLSDSIFLAIWSAQINDDENQDLVEVINALVYNMNEVSQEGVKKSKVVFQASTK